MSRKAAVRQEPGLPFLVPEVRQLPVDPGKRAIEDDCFPFEFLSDVCEVESWRKEINRPIYHIHKWWAHRLGTAFRAIVLGTFAPTGADVLDLFYQRTRLPTDSIVFDPFMGSGTTIGETLKLGGRAVGRDINPVAHFLVQNALSFHERDAILSTFKQIEADVAGQLRSLYSSRLADGQEVEVLYFFWVKTVDCPECHAAVDLFSSYVFAQHAYPRRFPEAHAVCPGCGDVNKVRFDSEVCQCGSCDLIFALRGPASGQTAACKCGQSFSIAKTVRQGESPPQHRLYAKLVLHKDGTKEYLRATAYDHQAYAAAAEELRKRSSAHPVVEILPGYNTNQALGYNYRYWHQMFNERQLLALSILAERIREIPSGPVRDLFVCLFSGALEFNNMFASYKGEGTGAVRHMFAHHILKPERVPLEANLWGTPKSSGSFSTIFEGRIRRALEYAEDPFELRVGKAGTEKVKGLSEPMGYAIADSYHSFSEGRRVYLSCGDSSSTDIPDRSVDAVVTDPPFFDNVHYSQLADFFHVWQRHIARETQTATGTTDSTRSVNEVQSEDVSRFTGRLTGVFLECHRVLKDEGVLAFTYHHSRPDGWHSIVVALVDAGFVVTASQPIKAEMSVAMPKHQAKEPINLDIVLVCRKRRGEWATEGSDEQWASTLTRAGAQVERFASAGRHLSRNDIRVILMGQLLRELTAIGSSAQAAAVAKQRSEDIERAIVDLVDSSRRVGSSASGVTS